jgi:adenylate cyclase
MHILFNRKTKYYYGYILLSVIFSLIYIAIVDGFHEWFHFRNGLAIGITIGLLFIFFEFYIYKKFLKRLQFIHVLILRSFYYLIVIITTLFFELILVRMIRDNNSFSEVLFSEEFQRYLTSNDFRFGIVYAFILILIINFSRQMNAKLGQGNFVNFILGRYVTPVRQERIFMFIKINLPETTVYDLSSHKYITFLNEIIFDITEVIINYYGELYEYVDDTIVVSWPIKKGINNANCIRAYYESIYVLTEEKIKYLKKFGISPKLSAALHMGKTIRGELGDVKSTIVYSGDVMNMTSRILDQCSIVNQPILISESLMHKIDLPEIYYLINCGDRTLRGKKESVALYAIGEKEFQYV